MKITLIRTGGMIPVTKKAAQEVDWNEKDLDRLISAIKADDNAGEMRDNTQYQLIYNKQSFPVDLQKIPEKYKETFESLKDNLQIVKPG
jgi:muramidase (phage lysozyme)